MNAGTKDAPGFAGPGPRFGVSSKPDRDNRPDGQHKKGAG